MGVTFRGFTRSGVDEGGTQQASKSTAFVPSSLSTDCVVLIWGCWASAGQATPSLTWPTGFVGHEFLSVSVAVPSGGTLWLKMAWGAAITSGSYTVTTASSYWAMLLAQGWVGVDMTGADPLDGTVSTSTNGANTTSIADTAVTTATLAGLGWACQTFNDATATVQPTGYTKDDGGTTVLHAAHEIASSTGAQSATGATSGAVSTVKVAGLYGLKAAGAGGSNLTQAPSDAEGLTDSAALSTGKNPVDPEGLADSAVLDVGKSMADAEGLTDAVALSVSPVLSDSEGLTDSATVTVARAQVPADAEGLSDTATIIFDRQVLPSDVVALSDSTATDVGKGATDPIGLTDSAQVQLVVSGVLAPTDTEQLVDVTALDTGKSLGDSLGLTDAVQIDLFRQLSVTAADNESLTDTVTLTKIIALNFLDTTGLGDQDNLAIGASYSDDVGLSDGAQVVLAANHVLSDDAGLTDFIVLHLGPVLADRDLTLVGEIEARRFSGTIATGRFAGSLQPGRWKGAVKW
jgi:hypothetical protein